MIHRAYVFVLAALLTFFALPATTMAASFCPEGGERYTDSEKFCPTHGTKLKPLSKSSNAADKNEQPSSETTQAKTDIKKVKGGYTVGDIFAKRNTLNGQTVKVRGKVSKYSAEIMQVNWIHLQDGTGSEETNNLVVTSDAVVTVGDQIVVEGVIIINKDFGYGYTYEVMMENADVTIETSK